MFRLSGWRHFAAVSSHLAPLSFSLRNRRLSSRRNDFIPGMSRPASLAPSFSGSLTGIFTFPRNVLSPEVEEGGTDGGGIFYASNLGKDWARTARPPHPPNIPPAPICFSNALGAVALATFLQTQQSNKSFLKRGIRQVYLRAIRPSARKLGECRSGFRTAVQATIIAPVKPKPAQTDERTNDRNPPLLLHNRVSRSPTEETIDKRT